MKTYNVRAVRWEHGWELHIDDIGVTQSHGLGDAETMARDLIARRLDVPADSFDLAIELEVGEGLDEEIRAARSEVAAADAAQRRAAAKSRAVARRMKERGMTGRDIATVLGVSPQRVSQLIRKAS